jgi:hypothetical protein
MAHVASTGMLNLVHPFAQLPTSPSPLPYLFAWHVKLDRRKSKDVLLALPEKQPQAYEKIRRLLGEHA